MEAEVSMVKTIMVPKKRMTQTQFYASDAHFQTEAHYDDYKRAHALALARLKAKKAKAKKRTACPRISSMYDLW
jgi:hypothetical protein